MKYKKLTAAVLAACALSFSWSGCEAAGLDLVEASHQEVQQGAVYYEHDGLRLRIPKVYEQLLITKIQPEETGSIFCVSEKASVEAAQKMGYGSYGPGWLFGIATVSEAELHDILCGDMSGRELFAQDGKGKYYIYSHPTDVRYMRETPAAMERDQDQWHTLCAWAACSVRPDFLKDNPHLTALTADNSNIGIYLANLSYRPVKYSLAKRETAPYAGEGVSARPFAEKLLYGNTFEMVQDEVKRRGASVKLSMADENVDLYFFRYKGETYVLEKRDGVEVATYKAIPVEEHAEALGVMNEWYEAVEPKG